MRHCESRRLAAIQCSSFDSSLHLYQPTTIKQRNAIEPNNTIFLSFIFCKELELEIFLRFFVLVNSEFALFGSARISFICWRVAIFSNHHMRLILFHSISLFYRLYEIKSCLFRESVTAGLVRIAYPSRSKFSYIEVAENLISSKPSFSYTNISSIDNRTWCVFNSMG
jgi:hypothetical protein